MHLPLPDSGHQVLIKYWLNKEPNSTKSPKHESCPRSWGPRTEPTGAALRGCTVGWTGRQGHWLQITLGCGAVCSGQGSP